MPRAQTAELRVLSWNVSRQRFFEEPQRTAGLLAAAAPDVLLLDEMPVDATVDAVREVLSRALPAAAWHVELGNPGGNRERGSISSRWPLQRIGHFDRLRYRLRDQRRWLAAAGEHAEELRKLLPRGVPAAGAIADIDGRRVLLVSFDLQCCGDSPQAFEEDKRQVEARLIRSAIAMTIVEQRPDAVIIGGDVNNVQGDAPLQILLGSVPGLVNLEVVREDGSDWTWDGRGTRFASKKIDHLLHGATLVALQARVLDTEGWPDSLLQSRQMQRDWSQRQSPHRPIVVDLRFDRGDGRVSPDGGDVR